MKMIKIYRMNDSEKQLIAERPNTPGGGTIEVLREVKVSNEGILSFCAFRFHERIIANKGFFVEITGDDSNEEPSKL